MLQWVYLQHMLIRGPQNALIFEFSLAAWISGRGSGGCGSCGCGSGGCGIGGCVGAGLLKSNCIDKGN